MIIPVLVAFMIIVNSIIWGWFRARKIYLDEFIEKNVERGRQLDDYADRLSSWETGQKVRNVAFVKFWRRCEKAAGLDPVLVERFNALVEEFRLEDEGDG